MKNLVGRAEARRCEDSWYVDSRTSGSAELQLGHGVHVFQRVAAIAVVAAVSWAPAVAAQPRAGQPSERQAVPRPAEPVKKQDVRLRATLSRTAIWVGDQIDYVVELTCAPSVDVLAEDLAKEKVKVDGLELLGVATEREPTPDGGTLVRARYRLTAYDIEAPARTVTGWSIRYYTVRPGERPEDTKPSGEVQVPSAFVALRSALPDQLADVAVRDLAGTSGLPRELRLARPVGLGLLIASVAPLALWGIALATRAKTRTKRPSARATRSHTRAALDEMRALDARTESGRREGYARLAATVRQHLAETRGIPAQALCAKEIAVKLQDTASAASAEELANLIAECERACYGPANRLPPEDRFADALRTAEQLLGAAA